jgi:hypothetical protein
VENSLYAGADWRDRRGGHRFSGVTGIGRQPRKPVPIPCALVLRVCSLYLIDLPLSFLVQASGWRLSQRSVIFLSSSPPIVAFPLSQIAQGRRSFPAATTFFYCSCLSGFFRNLVLEQCNFIAAILEHLPVLPLAYLTAACIHSLTPPVRPSRRIDLVETVICKSDHESSDYPRHLTQSL